MLLQAFWPILGIYGLPPSPAPTPPENRKKSELVSVGQPPAVSIFSTRWAQKIVHNIVIQNGFVSWPLSRPEKGVITKGVLSAEESLESLESLNSLKSLESLENGQILLCFPRSRISRIPKFSRMSRKWRLFWKDPFSKRPLFPNPTLSPFFSSSYNEVFSFGIKHDMATGLLSLLWPGNAHGVCQTSIKNLLMPLFFMGCFPGDFGEGKRPMKTQCFQSALIEAFRPKWGFPP